MKEKNSFKNSINNLSLPKDLKLLYHEILKIKNNDNPNYDLFKILLKSMADNSNSEAKKYIFNYCGGFKLKNYCSQIKKYEKYYKNKKILNNV